MMETTESMLETAAQVVNGNALVKVGDQEISFKAPYKRIGILEAISESTGTDVSVLDEEGMRELCRKLHIPADNSMGKGKLIDAIIRGDQ